MAKSNSNTVEDQPKAAIWNPDDLVTLAANLDSVANRVAPLPDLIEQINQRLQTAEAGLALVDTSRTQLPVELVHHINLAEVYNTVLAHLMQGLMLQHPRIHSDAKYRVQMIDQTLEFAETVVDRICVRHETERKVKVK